ncbi:MAG: hypothetical protein RKL24_01165 [Defluviicoccus sp.]|nr:hypothetical protein [Defluviicoccus sp.]
MSWTIQELMDFLDRKNIPTDSYSFYKDKDDAFSIDKIGNYWLVYYSERGIRNELGWAKNESQALNLLKLFLLEAHKTL